MLQSLFMGTRMVSGVMIFQEAQMADKKKDKDKDKDKKKKKGKKGNK
jgi:hypothetical protein